MEYPSSKNLNQCFVAGCSVLPTVIIQKQMGEGKVMFAYCEFHSIIAATSFPRKKGMREIHI